MMHLLNIFNMQLSNYTKKAFIFFLAISALTTGCSSLDCGLHEFEVWPKKFHQKKWFGKNLTGRLYKEDFFTFQATLLEQREEMLCDLVENYLKPGGQKKAIIELLGSGVGKIGGGSAFRTLPIEADPDRHEVNNENNLFYDVGQNASGFCYLVLMFDDIDRYKGCFRTLAV